MQNPIVAMITIGDPREHEWNTIFKKLATGYHQKAIETLRKLPIELCCFDELPRSIEAIKKQVVELKAKGAELFVLHIACWTWPNLATAAVQEMGLPTVLFANRECGSHSTVGLLGSGGALNQIGYEHVRIQLNYDETDLIEKKLMPLALGASAVKRLRGSIFGLFGGRSLGIDTGTYDPMQWKKLFAIDSEHIDQLEIIRRADMIEEERAQKMAAWLAGGVTAVNYTEKFTNERFIFQIKCYLATKDIIKEKNIDFAAIKCMPDLTNNYTPQCLSAAFLPSPYDAEGEKETTAFACEADADAALTMQMLKMVSGGAPTMFADVSHLDPEAGIIYLPNCGGMCSWFAARSSKAEENLAKIELKQANRPAGGAITLFTAAPGEITLARLTRKSGKYIMTVIPGEVITPDDKRREEFIKARGVHQLPMAYIKTTMNFTDFVQEFDSNHIAGVGGIHTDAIKAACDILGIEIKIMK